MSAVLPHDMLQRVLWYRACRYAQCLTPGDELIPDIDGGYIESFAALLPMALQVHGLELIGTVVHKLEETT